MKLFLSLILFSSIALSQGHMIRGTQDTTALPTTNLWEGRFISISGKFYEYRQGGWYYGHVDSLYTVDSLVANKLRVARNINGVPFNGTQDITITAFPLKGDTLTTPSAANYVTPTMRIADQATVAGKSPLAGSASLTTNSKGTMGTMSIVDSVSYSLGMRCDSVAFTTTALRVALFAPGMTAAGYSVASPRITSDATPNASDVQLTTWNRIDSVVVHRIASGTSGLRITIIYRKK